MRNLFLIIIFCPVFIKAQQLKQCLFIAGNMSYYTSNDKWAYPDNVIKNKNYWDASGSIGYGIEYYLKRTFSVGLYPEYFVSNANLYTYYPIEVGSPQLSIRSLRNSITINSIELPLVLKLRTNMSSFHYSYFYAGAGINLLLYNWRKVSIADRSIYGGPPEYKEIKSESFQLKNKNNNSFGSFIQLGAGRAFSIKEVPLFAEFYFRHDLNAWIYKTIPNPDSETYSFKRMSLNLKIGIFLSGKKNKAE